LGGGTPWRRENETRRAQSSKNVTEAQRQERNDGTCLEGGGWRKDEEKGISRGEPDHKGPREAAEPLNREPPVL